jgi:hypothetical protein
MQHISSLDGSITVTVDSSSASISALQLGNYPPLEVDISGGIDQGLVLLSDVQRTNGNVVISRLVCTEGLDLPCSNLQAWVNTTLSAEETHVKLSASVEGFNVDKSKPTPPWTAPIAYNFTFAEAEGLKLWAPWDRAGRYDPLNPSDGGYSWWTGEYSMGTALSHHVSSKETKVAP